LATGLKYITKTGEKMRPLIMMTMFVLFVTQSQARLIESYTTRIGKADHYNSRGMRLENAGEILRQDRANFYRYRLRDVDDQSEYYFRSQKHRRVIPYRFRRGGTSRNTAWAIANQTPLIRVNVYSSHIDAFLADEKSPQTQSTITVSPSDDTAPPLSHIYPKVLKVANLYAEAVSCVGTRATLKDILVINANTNLNNGEDDRDFLVFWYGDMRCAGGSGTSSYNLAWVKHAWSDYYYVEPVLSSPTSGISTRFLDKLVSGSGDTIVIEMSEYGKNDPNCCASMQYRYIMRVDKDGHWEIVDKKFLRRKRF
jgi:hypothetical protein